MAVTGLTLMQLNASPHKLMDITGLDFIMHTDRQWVCLISHRFLPSKKHIQAIVSCFFHNEKLNIEHAFLSYYCGVNHKVIFVRFHQDFIFDFKMQESVVHL